MGPKAGSASDGTNLKSKRSSESAIRVSSNAPFTSGLDQRLKAPHRHLHAEAPVPVLAHLTKPDPSTANRAVDPINECGDLQKIQWPVRQIGDERLRQPLDPEATAFGLPSTSKTQPLFAIRVRGRRLASDMMLNWLPAADQVRPSAS
jgi:hypothetical protein